MKTRLRILALLAGLAAATSAGANAAIPILAVSWPAQWLAFVPVVAGEAAIVAAVLRMPFKALVKPAAIANLWSTLAGVPLAWLAMVLMEGFGKALLNALLGWDSPALRYLSVPMSAPWIRSAGANDDPGAFVAMMAVFCAVSVLIEHRVIRRELPAADAGLLARGVRRANLASYAALTAVALVALALGD